MELTNPNQSWERKLLAMTHQARQVPSPSATVTGVDDTLLKLAYEHCEALTAQHSRSFYMASRLLPKEKRQFVRALYAFCRCTDDIVDFPDGRAAEKLDAWRQSTLHWKTGADDLTVIAWIDMCQRTRMPMGFAGQLIDGVARDLNQTRYATFADLAVYCYGVASTVGLMSMQILGFQSDDAIPYAIKLGVALQLTNILRDIAEDWERGRLYLPLEELAAFGITEEHISRQRVDDRWRAFMRFQVERTRRLYAEAWPGIAMIAKDGRLSTAAAAELYGAILTKIEEQDYDVFSRRAYVSGWGKVSRLPGLWWRTRAFQFESVNRASATHNLA